MSFDHCIPLACILLEVVWELEVDPKMRYQTGGSYSG